MLLFFYFWKKNWFLFLFIYCGKYFIENCFEPSDDVVGVGVGTYEYRRLIAPGEPIGVTGEAGDQTRKPLCKIFAGGVFPTWFCCGVFYRENYAKRQI